MSDFDNLIPVKFEINGKQLTMPMLTKGGFARHHVLQLFEELQSKGFGVYTVGNRGPGNAARFDPNSKCPPVYTIFSTAKPVKIQVTPPTPSPVNAVSDGNNVAIASTAVAKRVGRPQVKPSDDAEETTAESQTIHSLWSLSKNLVKDQMSSMIGYQCTVFANQILVLHRVRGGGQTTIEDAVKDVWPSIGYRVLVDSKRESEKIVDVVSILSGVGVLVLCPVGCTCGEKNA